ncbi:glutathione S-transferase DHAR2 [Artemisia annua]|uniref:Glutathione S-transferase DHAR2 n=1 Tax=Artemisia annua TaxID=35608 RepID=A0A2U1NZI9_ARTAN|nr:glutathione S-transferase DHAR2 [Artemisia annua]
MGKKNLFKTLIDKADNNGNCNICHVPPELSVSDALIRFVEVNPDGILPLIKFDDEKWYSNSEDIVEIIDEKYPQPPHLTTPLYASVYVIFTPLMEFEIVYRNCSNNLF